MAFKKMILESLLIEAVIIAVLAGGYLYITEKIEAAGAYVPSVLPSVLIIIYLLTLAGRMAKRITLYLRSRKLLENNRFKDGTGI